MSKQIYCKNCGQYVNVEDCGIVPEDNMKFNKTVKEFENAEVNMSNIQLTKENFHKIWDIGRSAYPDALNFAKNKGWIIRDEIEQAIWDFENYCMNLTDHENAERILEYQKTAKKAIELLQNRIKELSK